MRGIAATVALAVLAVLVGCSEPPATGPTTQDFAKERDALAARVKKKQGQPQPSASATPAAEAAAEKEGGFAALDDDYRYDARHRRDPFRSWRYQDPAQTASSAVRGPLEQFELGQLAVAAIVWDTKRPRALVEDPSGQSYVVREGSRVGKNQGTVIHIGDNLVLVKETYVDFAGEQTTKDVELRIRRSQGG